MTAERRALIDAWAEERAAAKTARSRGDLAAEWHHLERAHILSQPMAGPHVRTHVSMLGYGLRRRDRRKIIGQAVRLMREKALRRLPVVDDETGRVMGVLSIGDIAIERDRRSLLGDISAAPGNV